MRSYVTTPEDDVRLTFKEYKYEVQSRRAPDLIGHLSNMARRYGVPGPTSPFSINIEKVQTMKNGMYWRVTFQAGDILYDFSAYTDAEKKVRKDRELILRDTANQFTTKYVFTSNTLPKPEVFKESLAKYTPLQRAENRFFVEPMEVKHDIKFGLYGDRTMLWTCSGCIGASWCQHRTAHLEARLDGPDLGHAIRVASGGPVKIKCCLPGGYVFVELTLEAILPERLGFDESDPVMMRLSYSDWLSIWIEDGDTAWALVGQLIDMVNASGACSTWKRRAADGMHYNEKCSNKHHTSRDSRVFNDAVVGIKKNFSPVQLDNYILCSAFSDYFKGRCIPCQVVLDSMDNDVAMLNNITGPATKSNPF